MELRFWNDPETGLPHIYDHDVTEEEVREVLARPGLNLRSAGNSRSIMGQSLAGRYLKVVFVPDPGGNSGFVVTAYELRGKRLQAYRRADEEKETMKKQRLPKGWTEEEIRKLAEHHDNLTDAEEAAEIEAALSAENHTVMAVPTELVPEILKLINKKRRPA